MLARNLLLAIGALALAVGAALAIYWFVQLPAARPPATRIPLETALVAAHPIEAGTLLRKDDVRWSSVRRNETTRDDLLKGQVSDADFVGAIARRSFKENETLVASQLLKSSDRDFLSAVLGPGMRAVSLAVDAAQSASGMIQPGDRVDAILTQKFSDAAPEARRTVGETILRNLRVVAVDQTMNSASRPSQAPQSATDPRLPKTITLEVSEEDAEKLMVAMELGKIGFSIRSLQSGKPGGAKTAPTWASDVSHAFGGPTLQARASTGANTQRSFRVEIIRGSKSSSP